MSEFALGDARRLLVAYPNGCHLRGDINAAAIARDLLAAAAACDLFRQIQREAAMTIRIIVQTCDASMAANVGGPVDTSFNTFDIEAPELEEFLRSNRPRLGLRQVIGAELLGDEP